MYACNYQLRYMLVNLCCVQCNILSFGELLRKSIFAFRGRIKSSNNTVIKCMVNSVTPLVSNVWKLWRTTLYTGHVTV